jgi:hypothetical protein
MSCLACSETPISVAGNASQAVAASGYSLSRVEKVDLLFVIDDSNSMLGEQTALRAQIPHMIDVLTRGERFPGDPAPFTPITDLHVGVVSSDMGTSGVEFGSCHADGGDDGRLQHTPRAGTGLACDAQYPPFLAYDAGSDPQTFADDVSCIAVLGTGGCGFEQSLEAPLKALWPSIYIDQSGQPVRPNPIQFLSTTPAGRLGRGDVPAADGGNLGFLRSDSLLVIALLTDEDDCSMRDSSPLWPNNLLPDDSPIRSQVDINLRCFLNADKEFDVTERYLKGLRDLRPGREDLVVFTAIAGVPVDLVDSRALANVDFHDPAARDAFYDGILNDARMQETVDPATQPGMGNGNLKPSCVRAVAGEQQPSTAYPPRRIVTLAKAFGASGMVQSICQDDFTPAIDSLLDTMARPLRAMCVTQPQARADDGTVACTLFWTLPDDAACADLGDVVAPESRADRGRCAIRQLAADGGVVEQGDGWYYDDFADDVAQRCPSVHAARVAYSEGVTPPRGASVKLECGGVR